MKVLILSCEFVILFQPFCNISIIRFTPNYKFVL